MRYSKGKTTVRDLIQKLQALGEEHLDKPIISFGTWGLERPDYFIIPRKNYYEEYNGCIILEKSDAELNPNSFKRSDNTPAPIIKDAKAICPCCGEEVVRSAEVLLSSPPIHTYYCTKCTYYKAIASFETIPEARIDYPDLPEQYIKMIESQPTNREQ